MKLEQEAVLETAQKTHYGELWPEWTGRDHSLIEPIVNEEGENVPGCYRTKPAPTYE